MIPNSNRWATFFSLILVLALASGCSSLGKKWKEIISGGASAEEAKSRPTGSTYSQQKNLSTPVYRQYKRTTRTDLESQAQLESRAGSLWVMEGQGAYLFSQNVVRMIGDPLSIQIEGDPLDQLSAKAEVINKLLTQIEERRKRSAARNLASEKTQKETQKADIPPPINQPPPVQSTAEQPKDNFAVKIVPTRVVERMVDGNYRVRGTQPFMIGSREYKVIVSGIIRAEDFNEQGVNASQLLDSNFDIVSAKGAELR